jgi:hypothetical protein
MRVTTPNFHGQVLTEDRHLFAIRRTNMRGKISLSTLFTALRTKPEQIGKLTCCQPREPASIIHPPEREASVTIEAVPSEIGDIESFAGHGLHGIPEQRPHMSNFYQHGGYICRFIGEDCNGWHWKRRLHLVPSGDTLLPLHTAAKANALERR